MSDGVYQVITSYLCAGFIVIDGVIVKCAPILLKKINYWKNKAIKIS